jgi:hypothetical protein
MEITLSQLQHNYIVNVSGVTFRGDLNATILSCKETVVNNATNLRITGLKFLMNCA